MGILSLAALIQLQNGSENTIAGAQFETPITDTSSTTLPRGVTNVLRIYMYQQTAIKADAAMPQLFFGWLVSLGLVTLSMCAYADTSTAL